MTESKTHDINMMLSNRSFFYTLLGRVFGDAPTASLLELISSEAARCQLDFAAGYSGELEAAIGGLEIRGFDEISIEKLEDEYTYLFLGPAELPAPLWESVYVNAEPLLFQESTLEVRNLYRAAGYLPAGYPHVADDHLAIELNFLAALSSRATAVYEDGIEKDSETCSARLKELLGLQKEFLDQHLLLWVELFADKIAAQHRTGRFYPQMARIAAAFALHDRRIVAEIVEAL